MKYRRTCVIPNDETLTRRLQLTIVAFQALRAPVANSRRSVLIMRPAVIVDTGDIVLFLLQSSDFRRDVVAPCGEQAGSQQQTGDGEDDEKENPRAMLQIDVE